MCTIGTVFDGENIHTFKQCDLIPETKFNEPVKRKGFNQVDSYIAMTREGSDGVWAGVNDAGVAFVAADSYSATAANYAVSSKESKALFRVYETCISSYASARDAAKSLINFYKTMGGSTPFPAPDISLISGWSDAEKTQAISIFIEYMPNPYNQDSIRTIERSNGFFVSTNHFRLQPNAVNYPANHSTYLRLNRAETILQSDCSKDGIESLLRDQYYGQTELSICRETDYIGTEFRTQATALFTVTKHKEPKEPKKPVCDYQINGNPKNNDLRNKNL